MKRRRAKNKAKKVVAKSITDDNDNRSAAAKKSRTNSFNNKNTNNKKTSEDEDVKTKKNENIDLNVNLFKSTCNDDKKSTIDIKNSSSIKTATSSAKKITQQTDQYSNESFSNEDTTSSSISTNSNEINLVKSGGNNSNKANYLFIELKLISIDAKCVDYFPLEQRFLCLNSANSLIRHLEKFIINKMKLNDQLFEVRFGINII